MKVVKVDWKKMVAVMVMLLAVFCVCPVQSHADSGEAYYEEYMADVITGVATTGDINKIIFVPDYSSSLGVWDEGTYNSDGTTYIGAQLKRSVKQAATMSGTVKTRIYYDFNSNGKPDNDELIETINTNIEPAPFAKKYLSVCEAAIKEYGTSTYYADLAAIDAYIFKNYEYGPKYEWDCGDGAYCLQVWSAVNYNIPGQVKHAHGVNTHLSFVDNNGAWNDAQGHVTANSPKAVRDYHGTLETPGSDAYNKALASRETQVRKLKQLGL